MVDFFFTTNPSIYVRNPAGHLLHRNTSPPPPYPKMKRKHFTCESHSSSYDNQLLVDLISSTFNRIKRKTKWIRTGQNHSRNSLIASSFQFNGLLCHDIPHTSLKAFIFQERICKVPFSIFPRFNQVWLKGSRCHVWIINSQFYRYMYGCTFKVLRSGAGMEEFWINVKLFISE